jgi:glycosyltransferase involved in cell wall biosynthesis
MLAARAVYIAFEAFPRPKGASTHIAAMVCTLAGGEGPVLLLCCGHGDMPAVQQEGLITIRRHKLYHPNMLRRAVDFGAFVRAELARLREPPMICVFRDPWSGVPALEAGLPSAYVFEVNGLPSWELGYLYPAVHRNAALRAKIEDLEQYCLDRADALITVSAVTREALARRHVPPERVRVVPNAAADVFFSRPAAAEPPITELASGRWFGYVGSLHPWQGVDVLLSAWARIAADWPEVHLLILHNNSRLPLKPLRKRVRRLGLESRVLLHPPLPPESLAAALPWLEFTCAPLLDTFRNTVQGCCPIKIVESMAAGVPVVASDLRVTRELITATSDGWLVPASEPRAWSAALHRLLADRELRAALAVGATETARTRFTNDSASAKLVEVFAGAKQRARQRTRQREERTVLAETPR